MPDLSLNLFGGFTIQRPLASPVDIRSAKSKALLAYLASQPGQSHSRDKLAALFWENSDRPQARKSLRQALAVLRSAVSDNGAPIIVSDGDRLLLDSKGVVIDVAEFEHLIALGTPAALEEAVAIYRGDFLDGFELKEEAFTEWLTSERTRLREVNLSTLAKLLDHYLTVHEIERGIQMALKLLATDPLQESVHCALMRFYQIQGRHGAALRQYESCRDTLKRDLGISPGPETEQLHRAILETNPTIASREGTAQSFDTGYGTSLNTFVGRKHELGLALDCWRRVEDGEGQVLHVTGEPGIGKSRIVQTLEMRLADRPQVRLHYHCSPFHTNSALHPVVAQLSEAAGFAADDPPATKLDKLEAYLRRSNDKIGDVAPLFAALLSIPTTGRYPDLQLNPQVHKERTMEALVAQFFGLAERQPVLAIVEDAQWMDPTTEEFFNLVIGQSQIERILIVIAYRPEYSPPWSGNIHVTKLTLNQLSQRQAATLAENVARNMTLRSELNRQIVARTDGVPLFVEELTKAVLESTGLFASSDGTRQGEAFPKIVVPASLRDSLIARLDRLGLAKEVAQVASVIGRRFSTGLLAAVMPLGEAELEQALDDLMVAELVFHRGSTASDNYTFKHALVRDAAYEGLPHSKRRSLHGAVAKALGRTNPGILNSEPELLAHHYTEANDLVPAIAHWQRAGERSIGRSANVEALNHIGRALELLKGLPASLDRDRQELELQLTLGAALIAPKSYSSEEVRLAFARSRQLSKSVGGVDQRFKAVKGLWNCYIQRAELKPANRLAGELSNIAQDAGEPDRLLMACRVAALTHNALGHYLEGLEACERGIEAYDPDRQARYLQRYGEDPGLFCYVYSAWTNSWLGNFEAASTRAEQALDLANRLPSRYARSYVLALMASYYLWQRRPDMALDCAYAGLEVAEEQGITQWLAWANVMISHALAAQGRVGEGLDRILPALEAVRAIKGWFPLVTLLQSAAEVYRENGDFETGLEVLDEADSILHTTGFAQRLSEFYRSRGNLLLESGAAPAQAEEAFSKAFDIAGAQRANLLKLRAAVSLARLWGENDRRAEARNLLDPIYGGFTEGFDTPDLRDAKSLLEALATE